MLRRPFRCLFYKLHVCSFNIYIVVLIVWKGIEILSLVLKQFWKIFKKKFEMKSPFRNIQSLKIVIWFKKLHFRHFSWQNFLKETSVIFKISQLSKFSLNVCLPYSECRIESSIGFCYSILIWVQILKWNYFLIVLS